MVGQMMGQSLISMRAETLKDFLKFTRTNVSLKW